MVKLHELKPTPGSKKKPTRKGRGTGSGLGKTAGRGDNGQNSRSGGGVRLGFEGGQMPLYRRVPKRGFTNIFKKNISIVNIEQLERFDEGTEVTPELLVQKGLAARADDGVKVLAKGAITKPITVKANYFSKAAKEKIEAAGGKAEVV